MTKFPSPLRNERGLMNAYDCGCQIRSDGSGVYYLCACPLHNAAQELLEALQAMLADVEHAEKIGDPCCVGSIASNAARAAIAKASVKAFAKVPRKSGPMA